MSREATHAGAAVGIQEKRKRGARLPPPLEVMVVSSLGGAVVPWLGAMDTHPPPWYGAPSRLGSPCHAVALSMSPRLGW